MAHLAIRGICYCRDCRAYSRHLGKLEVVHDLAGGAEFVATQAMHVTFESGTQQLACLSLSKNGLLRWYVKCCNTPIANTARSWRFPYVGLLHTCLKTDPELFERSFPKLQMRVNTRSARQAPPGMFLETAVSLLGYIPRIIASGLNGAYKRTPFFTDPSGTPKVAVAVLSKAEKERAYSDS
jgi:hypothetical protein